MKLASEAPFPYGWPGSVCYFTLSAGSLDQIRTRPSMRQAVIGALAGEVVIYATWPGQFPHRPVPDRHARVAGSSARHGRGGEVGMTLIPVDPSNEASVIPTSGCARRRAKAIRNRHAVEDSAFHLFGTIPASATTASICTCGARAFARNGADLDDFYDTHADCDDYLERS